MRRAQKVAKTTLDANQPRRSVVSIPLGPEVLHGIVPRDRPGVVEPPHSPPHPKVVIDGLPYQDGHFWKFMAMGAFRDGNRGDIDGNMTSVAATLTDAEITTLADYIFGLKSP